MNRRRFGAGFCLERAPMSTDIDQNAIPPLATQPSSVTLSANTTITGRLFATTVPGNTTSRILNIDLLAGTVVTDVNIIAALVVMGIVPA